MKMRKTCMGCKWNATGGIDCTGCDPDFSKFTPKEKKSTKEEKYGWMVEGEEGGEAVWMCIAEGTIIWSTDQNFAMRFCRAEDGAAMARLLCNKLPGRTLGGLRITDHVWTS